MRHAVVLGLIVTACTFEVDLDEPDRSPRATILVPSDDATLVAGANTFRGTVVDPQDDPERLFAVWSLASAEGGWRDVCSGFVDTEGVTLCVTDVEASDARIRLLASDPAGYQGNDITWVTVEAVEPPTLTLTEPRTEQRYYLDRPVPLVVTADDPDHAADELTVRWVSDVDGVLTQLPTTPDGTGVLATSALLSGGDHHLTVSVSDPDGGTARGSVYITVGPNNTPPTARIDAPLASTTQALLFGAPVAFEGFGADPDQEPADLTATLTSDVDGTLWTGSPGELGKIATSVSLTEGEHTLTLTVEDEVGAQATDTVAVLVDTPPTVTILKGPEDQAEIQGAVGPPAATVTLQVEVHDTRTTYDRLETTWRFTSGGAIMGSAGLFEDGTSAEFPVSLPGAGVYTLDITAYDRQGLETTVQRTFEVLAPVE